MQPNVITLPVDVLNTDVTTDEDYSRYEENINRSTYVGADHSLTARNNLTLYRTLPKKTGNFLGTAKSAFKFTQDYSVLGVDGTSLTAPLILEVSFSIPVGVTDAQCLHMRQRALALIDDDSVLRALNSTLMI